MSPEPLFRVYVIPRRSRVSRAVAVATAVSLPLDAAIVYGAVRLVELFAVVD
jgi:hypothetical protein